MEKWVEGLVEKSMWTVGWRNRWRNGWTVVWKVSVGMNGQMSGVK